MRQGIRLVKMKGLWVQRGKAYYRTRRGDASARMSELLAERDADKRRRNIDFNRGARDALHDAKYAVAALPAVTPAPAPDVAGLVGLLRTARDWMNCVDFIDGNDEFKRDTAMIDAALAAMEARNG